VRRSRGTPFTKFRRNGAGVAINPPGQIYRRDSQRKWSAVGLLSRVTPHALQVAARWPSRKTYTSAVKLKKLINSASGGSLNYYRGSVLYPYICSRVRARTCTRARARVQVWFAGRIGASRTLALELARPRQIRTSPSRIKFFSLSLSF